MRILLISPNTLTTPYPVYPIGLDYVAGSIRPEHELRIADLNTVSLAELEGILRTHRPDIIGLSCRNIDNTDAGNPLGFLHGYQTLAAWLRARSNAVLVCGGSGFSIMPAPMRTAIGADYGIIGDGERFGLLVDALAEGRDPAQLPGVISAAAPQKSPAPWRGPQQRVFRGDAAHVRFYLDRGGMLNLQSKRGCSFRCVYCPYPHIEGGVHRLAAPEQTAQTALALQAAGAKYLFITDSAFNSDVAHSLAVAQAFKAAGLAIPWGGFFAPVRLPPDYFASMAAAGLRHAEFGTESLSALMLKNYRKPFQAEDVFAAHQQAVAAGLHTAHYFLLGGPGESAATVAETLDRAEQLKKALFFFFIGIRIYPHTALHDIALAEGKISSATNLLEPVFYEPDQISRAEIERLVKERADGRISWVVGSGDAKTAAAMGRMHARGHAGPLWEHLIRSLSDNLLL